VDLTVERTLEAEYASGWAQVEQVRTGVWHDGDEGVAEKAYLLIFYQNK
jgi:hypothetical protein